jgi:hypothetical protein
MRSVLGSGPLICGLLLTFTLHAQTAQSNQNTSHTTDDSAAPTALNQPTRGVVFKTAAITGNATIASCFRCEAATTIHLGIGEYQVGFDENVQAINGWSRWVQVDTLGTGSVNAWCTTADRAGVPDAIFVSCQAPGGPGNQGNSKAVDVSFFLFVAR